MNFSEIAKNRDEVATLPPTVASTWLIALRTALVSVGLLSSTYVVYLGGPELQSNTDLLFTTFAILFFANGLIALWAKHFPATTPFLTFQLGFDSLIVTGVVALTNGPVSPFVFLYLPLQMIAAVFLPSVRSLSLMCFSSALYFFSLWSFTQEIGQFLIAEGLHPPSMGRILLHWSGLSIALYLVHLGTGKIRNSLLTNVELAVLSQAAAEEMAGNLTNFIESLPEAVVAVHNNTIHGINAAASTLFGAQIHEFMGQSVRSLSDWLQEELHLGQKLELYQSWDEITLSRRNQPGRDLKVIFHTRTPEKRKGAFGGTFYIFQDVTKLRTVEERLELQEKMARILADEPNSEGTSPMRLAGFIGESPVMRKLFQLIDRTARSDATVLIAGESGTGKELVAKSIHHQSDRADGPFIPVNCGAIPESLLESELFGHKKGAFTGAIADTPGLFVEANGGTIFLDEIGEMPLLMQAKLLRAIQEKTIRPVGSGNQQEIDVRIIAATNRDLKSEVEKGTFREDLYYRLNVIQMQIPSLRERKEDIPLLIQSIVKRISRSSRPPLIPPQTLALLMEYEYPGNVRELENLLERALVIGGDTILPEQLPETVRNPQPIATERQTEIIVREDVSFPVDLDTILADIEQRYLVSALRESHGVKKHAAQLLGMNFRSFRYRLQKFGLGDNS
ncbi:MAG: sigma 54-interacting transcriptional regulator [Bdellovibrionales bacterium]|nr:sigma 54-interacting transcriptional regulator [Bdellovibrionales bacterium]